jgi:hypothetical protein
MNKVLMSFPIVLPYFYGTGSAGARKHSYSIFLLTFRPAILRGKLPLELSRFFRNTPLVTFSSSGEENIRLLVKLY